MIEPEQIIPILIIDKFVLLLRLCIWDMIIIIIIIIMFIINQQRRCRVALHFTWFVVFLAFIWHDVYNYGIRSVWRYQRGNQNLYVIHIEMVFPKENCWRSEVQLSRGGWDLINRFNPAKCLCLSQTRNWFCKRIVVVLCFDVRGGCFVLLILVELLTITV